MFFVVAESGWINRTSHLLNQTNKRDKMNQLGPAVLMTFSVTIVTQFLYADRDTDRGGLAGRQIDQQIKLSLNIFIKNHHNNKNLSDAVYSLTSQKCNEMKIKLSWIHNNSRTYRCIITKTSCMNKVFILLITFSGWMIGLTSGTIWSAPVGH